MQFPFGLILIKVRSAKRCQNCTAGNMSRALGVGERSYRAAGEDHNPPRTQAMGCSVFVPKGWQLKILEVNTSRKRNPASFRGLTSLAPFLCRNYSAHGQKPCDA